LFENRQTGESGSLTEATVIRLRRNIVEGVLAPGSKLRIAALAEQLSVNPGAVREALSRLTAESLVTAKAQHGFRVSEVSIDEIKDITWTRIQIETIALRESMSHGSIA
jgi:DNA-binding GntR family transcriptional regulator